MLHGRVRFLKWFGLTGAATLLLTACPEDAVDIVEPKATALDFAVAPLGQVVFPAGGVSIDGVVLAQFDPTVADAFGRSVAGNDPFYLSTARGDAVDGTDFGPGWNFGGFDRNSTTDPRLPALTEDDAVLPVDDGFVIGDPAEVGAAGFHNPFTEGDFTGLQPTTTYVVALARLGTNVNGVLDQEQVLLGDPVADPDELVYVGGAPAGDPTVPIVSFPTIIAFQANANPYVLGNFTTDGNGAGFFDVVIDGGGGNLYDTDTGDPSAADFDISLVARNDATGTTFPRYNYLIVFEGAAVDAADAADNPQAVRIQMAQDFDATTGDPINNSFSPFPVAALTDDELVAAPGGAGRPDSVSVEFFNVEALGGGAVWQAWLVNRDESPITIAAATATYQRVAIVRELDPVTGEVLSETDSVLETVQSVSAFNGQLEADIAGTPQEIKHRLIVTDATTGGGTDAPGFFTDLVLSQESGPGATTPSVSSALWFQYTDQGGTPSDFFDDVSAGGSLSFGHIDVNDPTSTRIFSAGEFAQSSGLGGVLDVGGEFQEISVDLRNLPLPPQGYYYEGWLMNSATGATISMGPITTLPPDTVSLFDADVDQTIPGVTGTGIRFANARLAFSDPNAIISGTGTDAAAVLTSFFLTLEPKLGGVSKNVADLEAGSLPVEALITRRQ